MEDLVVVVEAAVLVVAVLVAPVVRLPEVRPLSSSQPEETDQPACTRETPGAGGLFYVYQPCVTRE